MNDLQAIRVRAPASSANLGPGFDTLALALGLYLECTLRPSEKGFRVRVAGAEPAGIPPDETCLMWRSFLSLTGGNVPPGAVLEIANDIPVGKGLGSSAAAIVAGLALANEWAGLGKSREDLVQAATEIEGHPDNVAAAILGGLVVSCQTSGGLENGSGVGRVVSVKQELGVPMEIVVVVPDFQLSTSAARAVLPAQFSRQDTVFNVQRAALLVAALAQGRPDLIREAMRDRLHQPYRAPLIPGLEDALELLGVPGLLGVALSGAGPSVLAFCSGHTEEVGAAIVACFRAKQIPARARVLPVEERGVVVECIA
jgi:homoserine kinase